MAKKKYIYQLTVAAQRKADAGLITRLGEEVFNLSGKDITITYPETRKRPETTVTFKGATQKQLEKFYNSGFQKTIERIEVTEAEKSTAKKEIEEK